MDESNERLLLRLARDTVSRVLRSPRAGRPSASDLGIDADALPLELWEKRAVFVTLTLRSSGALRGCIGEIEPVRPLWQAVMRRAVDAAFGDPRFPPLAPEEFSNIRFEISVLTPMRRVSSWRDIVIGRHGMLLEKAGRSAVFLPQVAPEQGWTLEETLTHLSMKAGLAPDEWRDGAVFSVFEAVVFSEES